MYELFDHTADLGLRIRADDLGRLFEEAAEALFSALVANLDAVRAVEQATIRLEVDRHDDLLHDWLAELLYRFHAEHRVYSQFEVDVTGGKLTATARGEPIDAARHEIETEIKAITYHGLFVEQDADGWKAEAIVDL